MSKKQEEFSLEKATTEIREIVDSMQKGEEDFDAQVALFKRGTELIAACRKYLDASEMQVQQLINGDLVDFSGDEA